MEENIGLEPCTAIAGIEVNELIAQHGSPLYVFSENALRTAYRRLAQAFQRHYADVQPAWSYKTNYLRAICAVFHQEGAGAEVVSDFEYQKARRLGIPGSDIIFNGPYKPREILHRAVAEHAKIQIDHFDELAVLSEIADQLRRPVAVGLRVHLNTGMHSTWSKFGFSADTDEAVRALKRINASPFLNLVGLHCHTGTFVLDPNVYQNATRRLIELAQRVRQESGSAVQYLNLGGGFPTSGRYVPPDIHVPDLDEYAQAIGHTIRQFWPKDCPLPRLYLESGRALVDDAGYLLTTIVARKNQPTLDNETGERINYLVDAGVHLLPASSPYPFPVRPARFISGPWREGSILGCLCMNTDILREKVFLPEMQVGDHLIFHPVGAYTISQSMQFITYRPRIVMVMAGGRVKIIRERETLSHLEALENLPDEIGS